MPRQAGFEDITLKNFSGLDLRGPSELLSNRSLQVFQNWEIGDIGQIKSRPGFQQKYDGTVFANNARFIGQHSNDTGANQLIVQTISDNYTSKHGAGRLYYTNNGGVSWGSIGSVDYSCGRSVQYTNGLSYIPTAAGLHSWNGSTWTGPIATSKNSSYNLVFAFDRLFTIDNASKNIFYSDANLPATWSGANFDFKTDNKDNIVGILNYRDRLVVFFTNSIRIINIQGPPSSWTQKFFSYYMGVQSQNCYYVYNDLLYFLSSEGFFRTDLSQVEELSKPIAPALQTRWEAPDQPGGTWQRYQDSIGYWRQRFFITVRTSLGSAGSSSPASTYKMFCYNVKNGFWSEVILNISNSDGLGWSPGVSYLPVFVGKKVAGNAQYNKPGLYMFTGDTSGRMYLFDDEDPVYYDGTSSATPYDCILRTRDIDGDVPADWKRCYTYSVRKKESGGQALSFMIILNGSNQGGWFYPTSSTTPKQLKLHGPGFFRTMSLQIKDQYPQNTEIQEMTFKVKKKSGLTDYTT